MGYSASTNKPGRALRKVCGIDCRASGVLTPQKRPDGLRDFSFVGGHSTPPSETVEKRLRPRLAKLEGVSILDLGHSAQEVITALVSTIGRSQVEELIVIMLDRRGYYVFDTTVGEGSRGELNGTFRELLTIALGFDASTIVLAHNHPSGSLSPSNADIRFTKQVRAIAAPLGVDVADHLIVTGRSVLSMARAGLL